MWRTLARDARLRNGLFGYGHDCNWTAAAMRFHLRISCPARRFRSKSSLGRNGSAGNYPECGLHALALPTNVFWHHRQSQERKVNGPEWPGMGLYDATRHPVALDRHLSQAIFELYRTTRERCGPSGPPNLSNSGNATSC